MDEKRIIRESCYYGSVRIFGTMQQDNQHRKRNRRSRISSIGIWGPPWAHLFPRKLLLFSNERSYHCTLLSCPFFPTQLCFSLASLRLQCRANREISLFLIFFFVSRIFYIMSWLRLVCANCHAHLRLISAISSERYSILPLQVPCFPSTTIYTS
jgi:hypothetical protein